MSGVAYCRLCLRTEGLIPLFDNEEGALLRSIDLKLVTGLYIRMYDGLPQNICKSCSEVVEHSLQLRNISQKADKMLKSVVGKMETCPTIQSKNNEVEIEFELQDTKKWELKDKNGRLNGTANMDYNVTGNTEKDLLEVRSADNEQQNTGVLKKKRSIPPPPYICTMCDKKFDIMTKYRAHVRAHTHFCVCENCGKRCRNNAELEVHRSARHGDKTSHKFKCDHCEYSSAYKEAWMHHQRRHTGERPYVCDHCGAGFRRRATLLQHLDQHNPERNFLCPHCPKREKSKKLLVIHMWQVHRPDKYKYRYLCPRCPKSYFHPGHARQHLASHHRVPRPAQGPIQKLLANEHK